MKYFQIKCEAKNGNFNFSISATNRLVAVEVAWKYIRMETDTINIFSCLEVTKEAYLQYERESVIYQNIRY